MGRIGKICNLLSTCINKVGDILPPVSSVKDLPPSADSGQLCPVFNDESHGIDFYEWDGEKGEWFFCRSAAATALTPDQTNAPLKKLPDNGNQEQFSHDGDFLENADVSVSKTLKDTLATDEEFLKRIFSQSRGSDGAIADSNRFMPVLPSADDDGDANSGLASSGIGLTGIGAALSASATATAGVSVQEWLSSYATVSSMTRAYSDHYGYCDSSKYWEVSECDGILAKFIGESHSGFKTGDVYPVVKTIGEKVVGLSRRGLPEPIYVDKSEVILLKVE